VRHVATGFFAALLISISLTLLTSAVICLGANPLLFEASEGAAPLLGILVGGYVSARGGSWKSGAGVGLVFVALWLGFWLYLMGRWNPLLWFEEGFPRLGLAHVGWWGAAILAGIGGGLLGKFRVTLLFSLVAAAYGTTLLLADRSLPAPNPSVVESQQSPRTSEAFGPLPDGTMGWTHTFDFRAGSELGVGIYDCDSDDSSPRDDSNTTYLGQNLLTLVGKLNSQKAPVRRQILSVINGGFFGASGWSVAHHELPIAHDGSALYRVDLLRPRDQAWFFAINSPAGVMAGLPRFSMLPSIPWDQLGHYQTVLGGVRPLRVDGRSLELKPGAGVTTLKCSRTSVGWNADGSEFYVLTVFDPDGELASQLQRRSGEPQTGGWDAAQVQKFWEDRGVPFALLFDGGESTQLAYRERDGSYFLLPSGYQYSFTLAYFRERPLRFTLPILPPSEAHRGVLNYFWVDGPVDGSR
jgi:hypothetical protein